MSRMMKLDQSGVDAAIEVLASGGLVAIPTETVYGLAADATNGEAVAGIFAAKGRPHFNPLIAHVSDLEMAKRYVQFDAVSEALSHHFWPGPLTIVLPLLPAGEGHNIHPLATAGLSTLAVRMPQGAVRDIIKKFDRPLSAPSANRSGRISATSADAVAQDLGERIDLILDAGACEVGLESTIVKVEGDAIYLLRPGGLAAEEIEAFTGKNLQRLDQRAAIQAPGMLQSHYAPDAQMRLNVDRVHAGEALLAFGQTRVEGYENAVAFLNLSESGNLREAAANLFDYMKKLDTYGATTIAVEPIPVSGLGEAIADRLARAAAPRG
ncbi:L-threonylcarbamoyladenylate synthase [Brucellaceae bacterium C25G]